jgi:hypothetical protein
MAVEDMLADVGSPTDHFSGDKGQQHLLGDEAWLIGEHRLSGICLANVPAKTDLHTFSRHHQSAMVMRARSPADKKRLGLDHFDADHGKAFIVMSS